MEKGESKYFLQILEQVLGLGPLTREKFFQIIEGIDKKKLSSGEFFRLLEIISRQQHPAS